MIIPVYKPLGASSHQLAAAIGAARGEKATHTGTLDPMAEGVLIVLTGADRFHKAQLSAVPKIYEFEMLFGIATDSHDLLGLPTKTDPRQLTAPAIATLLKKQLPQFEGTHLQRQPSFSAGRAHGKSFFDLVKEGQNPPVKKNTVTISRLQLLSCTEISLEEIANAHAQKVATVQGNFRQSEVLTHWQQALQTLPPSGVVAKLSATVSRRTYIRGLVRDLSELLTIPATTFTILRTQNGSYSIADCTPLTDVLHPH